MSIFGEKKREVTRPQSYATGVVVFAVKRVVLLDVVRTLTFKEGVVSKNSNGCSSC